MIKVKIPISVDKKVRRRPVKGKRGNTRKLLNNNCSTPQNSTDKPQTFLPPNAEKTA